MSGKRLAQGLWLVGLLGLVACAPREVLLVSVDGGSACESDADCAVPGMYCDRSETGCRSSVGFCRAMPLLSCSSAFSPVCGCDGLTYFNECLAAKEGASLSGTGECRDPRSRCVPTVPCRVRPSSHGVVVCARVAARCGPPGSAPPPGVCLFMPTNCSGEARACQEQNVCLNLCEALQSGQPCSPGCT